MQKKKSLNFLQSSKKNNKDVVRVREGWVKSIKTCSFKSSAIVDYFKDQSCTKFRCLTYLKPIR